MKNTILIRVPKESANDARTFWKELRICDALPPEFDLRDPDTMDRFDGSTLAEWAVPISEALKPLIGAFLGYLVARKGEVEIRDGNKMHKFRNMTPRQIKKITGILEDQRINHSAKTASKKAKEPSKKKRNEKHRSK